MIKRLVLEVQHVAKVSPVVPTRDGLLALGEETLSLTGVLMSSSGEGVPVTFSYPVDAPETATLLLMLAPDLGAGAMRQDQAQGQAQATRSQGFVSAKDLAGLARPVFGVAEGNAVKGDHEMQRATLRTPPEEIVDWASDPNVPVEVKERLATAQLPKLIHRQTLDEAIGIIQAALAGSEGQHPQDHHAEPEPPPFGDAPWL